jgi:Protein of unknown function (DUF3306)
MGITMTEEDFLKRWSRRKREAEVAKPTAPETATGEAEATPPDKVASRTRADTPDAEFDPATLPPIDSITAVSDITAFLRAGVPVELTRAALRRVWTADPAIRNFVGLAENAWDFTDPNAMPGFGPLESSDEVRRMIAQVVDQIGEAARAKVDEEHEPASEVSDNSEFSETVAVAKAQASASARSEQAPLHAAQIAAENSDRQVLLQSSKEDDAVHRDVTEDVKKPDQSSQRTHGGALPR